MGCYFVHGIHTSVFAIFVGYVKTDCFSVTVAEVRVYDCTPLFGFALLEIISMVKSKLTPGPTDGQIHSHGSVVFSISFARTFHHSPMYIKYF